MAKVTITLEDTQDEQRPVTVGFEFDPPLEAHMKVSELTTAQATALALQQMMREEGGGQIDRVEGFDKEGNEITAQR